MIPGGRMNERTMRMMMKRMGMSTQAMEDVVEVIIRRARDEIVLDHPEVTEVVVQGMKTYQVVGEPRTRALGAEGTPSPAAAPPAASPAPAGPPEEDVELVMAQAQVDRTTALKALSDAHGEPAEAILKLMSRRTG